MRRETYINSTRFQGTALKVPIPSAWKLVEGHWYWYVDQKKPLLV